MTFVINNGFWVVMSIIALVVITMNLVFWNLPPKNDKK